MPPTTSVGSGGKISLVGLKRARLVLFFVLAVSIAGWAQKRSLSLTQALAEAEQQNLDLVAARQRRYVAAAGIQIARERPNPNLSFSASRDAPHQSLLLDQPLEIGPKRSRRITLARGEAALTEVEISTLGRQIRRSVRDAFHQAEFAAALSAQKQELLELARRLHDIAQARFDAGDVAQLEVIQADLESARAEADLQLSRQEEAVAMIRLNVLLNEPADAHWDFVTALDLLPTAKPLTDLSAMALLSSPDLQHLRQEQKIEESRLELLRAEKIPDLSLGVGSDFNAPHDYQVGPRGQLSLNLPLFSRNQGEIAQSAASRAFLERDLEATSRTINAEVESASLEFAARATQVGIYRDRLVPTAKHLFQMAQESYQAGKANILTVIDAQRNAAQVQQEYLDSLLAAQSAFAALEETVGTNLD